MKIFLEDVFFQLLSRWNCTGATANKYWGKIKSSYSDKNRHYHTLPHLESVIYHLYSVKDEINDMDTVLFSAFYHDVVYSNIWKDNEEKSALLAQSTLRDINYPEELIELCTEQILATKTHTISQSNDANIFVDADLAILGTNWEEYYNYTINIRKEYSIYPDLIYKPGRIKVLKSFLEQPNIFKTLHFQNIFEKNARENIEKEIELNSKR